MRISSEYESRTKAYLIQVSKSKHLIRYYCKTDRIANASQMNNHLNIIVIQEKGYQARFSTTNLFPTVDLS